MLKQANLPTEKSSSVPKLPFREALAHMFYLFTDTQRELARTYTKYGEVVNPFSGRLARRGKSGVIWFFGPDANEQVLLNSEALYSSGKGWEYFLQGIFPGSVMAMDGKTHLKQRRIMSTAFKKSNLVAYLDMLNPQIESCLESWGSVEKFVVYPSVKRLTLDIATKVFMGAESGPNADKVNKAFIDSVEASVGLVRKDLPFTKHRKGVQGNQYLYKEFKKVLPQKRKELTNDFFSQFCHAESEEGERFTDDEIINHMIFLMMAAHDTTTSTICTLFYLLGKHPEWQEKLRDSSRSLGKAHIGYDDQAELELLDWCIREALRLHPPLPVMPRAASRDFSFNGREIKEGAIIFIAPLHTHYMEAYWSNPERFEPERFSPERKEHKSHAYAWIPFGGGAHMCIGQHFGFMEIKAIMHQVLLNYQWSIPESYSMPYKHIPIGRPGGKFTVAAAKIAT